MFTASSAQGRSHLQMQQAAAPTSFTGIRPSAGPPSDTFFTPKIAERQILWTIKLSTKCSQNLSAGCAQ
jgi:hypothetical protein